MLDILKYIVIGYCALATFMVVIGIIASLVDEFPDFFMKLASYLSIGILSWIIGGVICHLL